MLTEALAFGLILGLLPVYWVAIALVVIALGSWRDGQRNERRRTGWLRFD